MYRPGCDSRRPLRPLRTGPPGFAATVTSIPRESDVAPLCIMPTEARRFGRAGGGDSSSFLLFRLGLALCDVWAAETVAPFLRHQHDQNRRNGEELELLTIQSAAEMGSNLKRHVGLVCSKLDCRRAVSTT